MAYHLKKDNFALKRKAAIISLIIGCLLVAVKFAAYFFTDSTAILSDALESFVNIVTAVFALISVYVARKPPDAEHPYGHGKVEFISAGFEGAAVLGAAVLIIYKAVPQFVTMVHVGRLGIGLFLVGVAAVVNALLGYYLIRTGKKTSSITIEADGRHVLTDVYTSAGVLAGVGLIKLTGWTILDPIIALIVAANIVWIGSKLLHRSFSGMLDRVDPKDDKIIRSILEGSELKGKVCGYHHLRSRRSGGFTFVDFHLLIPREIDIGFAHEIATLVEEKIAEALGDASVMAHLEPCKDKHCKICNVQYCDKRNKED